MEAALDLADKKILRAPIAEMFYSLQGEGPSKGTPAIFIRFGGCNLDCGNGKDATWVCDSILQWKDPEIKHLSPPELISQMKELSLPIDQIYAGEAHIVFTGGEPTLPKNATFIKQFVRDLRDAYDNDSLYDSAVYDYFNPYYEIETNGTIWDADLFKQMHQVNCSPKLKSSGMSLERRLNKEVLLKLTGKETALASYKDIRGLPKPTGPWFKFVIEGKEEEWQEIVNYFSQYIYVARVILMPAGMTREEVLKNYTKVWEMGVKYCVAVSNRDHIMAYDNKVGV